jgi:hypothetical protein
MESLPWELIGQIGANLLPKWRCRLYICCREWYYKCYSSDDMLKWYIRMRNTISYINTIKYRNVRAENGLYISELLVENNFRYSFYCPGTAGYRDESTDKSATYISGKISYIFVDMIKKSSVHIMVDTHGQQTTNRCRQSFYEIRLRNRQLFKLYEIGLKFLRRYAYITMDDCVRLIIAIGKDACIYNKSTLLRYKYDLGLL